ncbi:MAG: hypothetical protein WC773_00445 [Patescibacteria group bacterium]|jgi:hypothetical protein
MESANGQIVDASHVVDNPESDLVTILSQNGGRTIEVIVPDVCDHETVSERLSRLLGKHVSDSDLSSVWVGEEEKQCASLIVSSDKEGVLQVAHKEGNKMNRKQALALIGAAVSFGYTVVETFADNRALPAFSPAGRPGSWSDVAEAYYDRFFDLDDLSQWESVVGLLQKWSHTREAFGILIPTRDDFVLEIERAVRQRPIDGEMYVPEAMPLAEAVCKMIMLGATTEEILGWVEEINLHTDGQAPILFDAIEQANEPRSERGGRGREAAEASN